MLHTKIKLSTVRNLAAILCTIIWLNPKFSIINPIISISIFVTWLVLAYFSKPRLSGKILYTPIVWVYASYIGILILNLIFGRAKINTHDILAFIIIIFVLYYIELDEIRIIKNIVIVNFGYLSIIVLISIIKLEQNPNLARILAQGSDAVFQTYATSFTASYSTVYLVALLVPLLIVVSRIVDKRFLIAVVIGFFFLIKAQYTTAILLTTIFGGVYFFLDKTGSEYRNIAKVITFIIICGTIIMYIQDILEYFVNFFQDTTVARRLQEILEIIQKGSLLTKGDSASRVKYFFISWNTFIENFWTGIGFRAGYFKTVVGGHSSFVDQFAKFGVFGAGFYWSAIGMLFLFQKKRLARQTKRWLGYVVLEFFCIALLNTVENIMLYWGALGLIPFFIKWMDYRIRDCSDK